MICWSVIIILFLQNASLQPDRLVSKAQCRSVSTLSNVATGDWSVCLDFLDHLHHNQGCVVYSFNDGRGGPSAVDEELASRGCSVHMFDPTLAALTSGGAGGYRGGVHQPAPLPNLLMYHWGIADFNGDLKMYPVASVSGEPVHYTRTTALAANTSNFIEAPVFTLDHIMHILGHRHVHILKLDIGGGEQDLLRHLTKSGAMSHVDQVLVSLYNPATATDSLTLALQETGFHILGGGASIADKKAPQWLMSDTRAGRVTFYKHLFSHSRSTDVLGYAHNTPWSVRRAEDEESVTLPAHVHVLMPSKEPKELNKTLQSLFSLADKEFSKISVHVGIDWGDAVTNASVMASCRLVDAECYTYQVLNRKGDVSTIVNHVFNEVDQSGYFFRFNDDTVMLTQDWNRLAIDALRNAVPPNLGLAYIQDTNNPKIQTHSFVSSVHKTVFGTFFPVHFKNWFEDDWITAVYAGNYTRQTGVKIHHLASKERYQVDRGPAQVWQQIAANSRKRIEAYVKKHSSFNY